MQHYQQFFHLLAPYLANDKKNGTYCSGRVSYDWTKTGGLIPKVREPGTYEQEVESFLSRDPGSFETPEENLLILLGGIGTGKSTSILRCLDIVSSRGRVCSASGAPAKRCDLEPKIVLFDFRNWNDDQGLKGEGAREESFWNFIAATLSEALTNESGDDFEILTIWPWLASQAGLLRRSIELNRFFIRIKSKLQAAVRRVPYGSWNQAEVIDSLRRDRAELLQSINAEGLAWYEVVRFAYESRRDGENCRCAYLIVDNVDGLDPPVQRQIVSFAQLLCSVLHARTVVALRPLTWRNTHGEFLIDVKDHCAPYFQDVIRGRLAECRKHNQDILGTSGVSAINHLSRVLLPDGGLLHKMMRATSGLSVRYALRNFYNMLESPIVSASFQKPGFVQSLTVSETARAYFFGGKGGIIDHAFDNLYITGSAVDAKKCLIKPRIIDFIKRKNNGIISLSEVFIFMAQFGHQFQVVATALSELTMRSRPLLWSEDGYSAFSPDSKARIMVTPIGAGYFDDLFGEPFYEEVCLIKNLRDSVQPADVLAFHRELTETDLSEVEFAAKQSGPMFYRSAYPTSSLVSLSLLHWRHLFHGLKNIQEVYAKEIGFDRNREDWIVEKVKSILVEYGEQP